MKWRVAAGFLSATLVFLQAGCIQTQLPEAAETAPAEPAAAFPARVTWRELAPATQPRSEHCSAVHEGKIYTIGGFPYPHEAVTTGPFAFAATASVEVYDTVTGRWSSGPDYPVAVDHHSCAATGGSVYVFKDANSYRLDLSKNTWLPIQRPPSPHDAGTAATDPSTGKIFLSSGRTEASLHIYDPKTDAYEEAASLEVRRDHAGSAFVEGVYYVAGGDVAGHAWNTASIEAYDSLADEWYQRAPMETPRGSVAVTAWYGRVVVLGGQNQTTDRDDPLGFGQPSSNLVEAYDLKRDAWTKLPPMPKPRHGFSAVTWLDKLYAVGGAPVEGIAGSSTLQVLEAAP